MNIIRLTSADISGQLFADLIEIYCEALPISEQKSRTALLEMLANKNYYFYVLSLENNTLGFAIIYADPALDYCLLEYMAIISTKRSGGYGGRFFDELMVKFPNKTMVIEIESPYQECDDQVIRSKRKIFYERHASAEVQGLRYILPLETTSTPPDMLILLHAKNLPDKISKSQLKSWLTDIYVAVYGCKKEDQRINIMFDKLGEELRLNRHSF